MFVLTAIATVSDIRGRRIPNLVSLVLVTSGLIEAALFQHGPSPVEALQGMLVGFALSFPFFAIRALGAGDVKLLAGIGAWVGVGPILHIMLVSVMLAGVLAVVQSLFAGRLFTLLRNCFFIVVHFAYVRRLGVAYAMATGQSPGESARTLQHTLPYAVSISAATVLTVMWPTLLGRLL